MTNQPGVEKEGEETLEEAVKEQIREADSSLIRCILLS